MWVWVRSTHDTARTATSACARRPDDRPPAADRATLFTTLYAAAPCSQLTCCVGRLTRPSSPVTACRPSRTAQLGRTRPGDAPALLAQRCGADIAKPPPT
eukprot:365840-Chlamydomonas_euryale.AAC.8